MSRPPFVVDLHAHLPMHLDPDQHSYRRHLHRAVKRHESLKEKLQFDVLLAADWLLNWTWAGPAVTLDTLSKGNVGVALSVAYWPFAEMDVDVPYGSPPSDRYYGKLRKILKKVDNLVRHDKKKRAAVVRSWTELDATVHAGKTAIIHAVEGGFHLGATPEVVVQRTRELASLGVGYITVAHLFWRRVATNCPAIPFLPDEFYRTLFPQDPKEGLDALGEAMIREMVREGILVDVTHMSVPAMRDTFALLDAIDPERTVPVIASHIACSFGKYAYNLTQEWVERIAERNGVCGIIYCDHFMRDDRGSRTRTFSQSFRVIESQIERLLTWTNGKDDVLAIGSDLDGFIKPTLAGLSSAKNHRRLAARLERRYGRTLAEKICHANAMRVLKDGWMKKRR